LALTHIILIEPAVDYGNYFVFVPPSVIESPSPSLPTTANEGVLALLVGQMQQMQVELNVVKNGKPPFILPPFRCFQV
jgi:hypothetical protein